MCKRNEMVTIKLCCQSFAVSAVCRVKIRQRLTNQRNFSIFQTFLYHSSFHFYSCFFFCILNSKTKFSITLTPTLTLHINSSKSSSIWPFCLFIRVLLFFAFVFFCVKVKKKNFPSGINGFAYHFTKLHGSRNNQDWTNKIKKNSKYQIKFEYVVIETEWKTTKRFSTFKKSVKYLPINYF